MPRMRLGSLVLALLGVAGCVVKGSAPPVTAGDGVSVSNGVVTLDEGKVPVLPSCVEGQLVAKTQSGWACVTPAQPELLKAGDGIHVESNTISARFGSGHTDVAVGDHNHDGVYRKASEKVAWGEVDASMTDVWPGTVPYSQVSGAPALDWSGVGATVKQSTPWPGQVDYSHLTNTPAPYSDLQAQAAVSWGTVKSTVKSTDVWPGTMPYSDIANAPAQYTDAQAQAAVSWGTVKGSVPNTTPWPGTVDYSHVSGAPAQYTDAQARAAVSWNTVGPTVPNGAVSNAMLANSSFSVSAQSPLTGGTANLGGSVSLGLGTVPVANGGTGQLAWPAGSVVSANGSGTALGGIAPGPAGNVLGSTGSAWQSQPLPTSGLARITTAPLTFYVRPNGDDAACDGLADADAPGGHCAFKTPQHAVDAVPEFVRHPVAIAIAAGTYYASGTQASVLNIAKTFVPEGGSITVSGGGAATLSGALAGSPTTPVALRGVAIIGAWSVPDVVPVTLSGVTVTNTTGAAVDVESSTAALSNVTVQNVGGYGLLCDHHALCLTMGTVSVTNSASGVRVTNGSTLKNTGTLSSNNNPLVSGITVDTHATVDSTGSLVASGNGGHGLSVFDHGHVVLTGGGTFASNADDSIRLYNSADVKSAGDLVITGVGAVRTGVWLANNSDFLVTGGTVSISCNSAGGNVAVSPNDNSNFDATASSFTISNCETGFYVYRHSKFAASGSGSQTITGYSHLTALSDYALYVHGNFPAMTSCPSDSICQ
jgi:hypothetical protein